MGGGSDTLWVRGVLMLKGLNLFGWASCYKSNVSYLTRTWQVQQQNVMITKKRPHRNKTWALITEEIGLKIIEKNIILYNIYSSHSLQYSYSRPLSSAHTKQSHLYLPSGSPLCDCNVFLSVKKGEKTQDSMYINLYNSNKMLEFGKTWATCWEWLRGFA